MREPRSLMAVVFALEASMDTLLLLALISTAIPLCFSAAFLRPAE